MHCLLPGPDNYINSYRDTKLLLSPLKCWSQQIHHLYCTRYPQYVEQTRFSTNRIVTDKLVEPFDNSRIAINTENIIECYCQLVHNKDFFKLHIRFKGCGNVRLGDEKEGNFEKGWFCTGRVNYQLSYPVFFTSLNKPN